MEAYILSIQSVQTPELTTGEITMATGHRATILGKKIVVNLNAKKGYRVSPGVNARARAVQKCAKGKSLEARKSCFKSTKA